MKTNSPEKMLSWLTEGQLQTTDLMPEIRRHFPASEARRVHRRLSFATGLLIAIAAVLAITGVVYAAIRFADYGIEQAKEADLLTPVVQTAKAGPMPTATPALKELIPEPKRFDLAADVDGYQVILNTAFLSAQSLQLEFSLPELPANLFFSKPVFSFSESAVPYPAKSEEYFIAESGKGRFQSLFYMPEDLIKGTTALAVKLPLLQTLDQQEIQIAEFSFVLEDLPVNKTANRAFPQTRSVSLNGDKYRIASVLLRKGFMSLGICAQPEVMHTLADQDLAVQDKAGIVYTPKTALNFRDGEESCKRFSIDLGPDELSSSYAVTLKSLVHFMVSNPNPPAVEKVLPAPGFAPLQIAENEQVKASLDWAYADVFRVAFGFSISGLGDLPDELLLKGNLSLAAPNCPTELGMPDQPVLLSKDPADPSKLIGTTGIVLPQAMNLKELELEVDLSLDPNGQVIGFLTREQKSIWEIDTSAYPSFPMATIGNFHFTTHIGVHPLLSIEPHLVNEAAGLKMELAEAQISPSASSVLLCYQKPDGKDWGMSFWPDNTVSLSLEGQTSTFLSYSLEKDSDYQLKNEKQIAHSLTGEHLRCVTLGGFRIGHGNKPSHFRLEIPSLDQSLPEVYSAEALAMAREKLLAQGIEMSITAEQGAGGGGGGPVYTKLPDGMSKQEAFSRFIDAIGYRINGPWIFEFDVEP